MIRLLTKLVVLQWNHSNEDIVRTYELAIYLVGDASRTFYEGLTFRHKVAIPDDRPRRMKSVITLQRRGLMTKNKNQKIA